MEHDTKHRKPKIQRAFPLRSWLCRFLLVIALCLAVLSQGDEAKAGPFPTTPPPVPLPNTALTDAAHRAALILSFTENWVRALLMMTEQFSAVMMQQMEIVGTLLDAKFQLETQALFQELTAQAHKDYYPSVEMCIFGTNVRSLAASERKSKINARLLNEIMLDREVLNENMSSTLGFHKDLRDRFKQFSELYCDPANANAELRGSVAGTKICDPPTPTNRVNNDIDYPRMVESRLTLDIDFTDNPPPATDLTEDEEDIIALSKNLFSHRVFARIPPKILLQEESAKDTFQDARSVIAMRGVARNSFSHLIGMRVAGTPEVANFLKVIFTQLGVPAADLDEFVGKNPSYFAQMEVLTKKIYQNPDFYTNLYTKPVNVDRTGVALQALQLMQDRDRFEASLRKEMLISMLLEVKLREAQDAVDNSFLGGSAK